MERLILDKANEIKIKKIRDKKKGPQGKSGIVDALFLLEAVEVLREVPRITG